MDANLESEINSHSEILHLFSKWETTDKSRKNYYARLGFLRGNKTNTDISTRMLDIRASKLLDCHVHK